MCNDFNINNVDIFNTNVLKLRGKENPLYEHTLEYKIKHPIVIFLRKIKIYDFLKKILRRGEDR